MMLDTIMNHLKESEPVHLVLQTMTVTVMSLSILWLIFYGKDSKWEGGLEFGEDAVAEEAVSSPKAGCKACEDPDTKKMSAAEVKKELAAVEADRKEVEEMPEGAEKELAVKKLKEAEEHAAQKVLEVKKLEAYE